MKSFSLLTAALVCLPVMALAQMPPSRPLGPLSVPIGASSTAVLPSVPTRSHLELLNQSATQTIWCTLDGSSAVAAATGGQITLFPGGGQAWTTGIVPSNAVNCIASAPATPLTVLQ